MLNSSTLILVEEIPQCDVCKNSGVPNNPALIDCKTTTGQWANVCLYHYKTFGVGLGLGLGQLLLLDA